MSDSRLPGPGFALLLLLAFGAVGSRAQVWTDDPLVPGATPVRAVHLTELRARVNERLAGCGAAPFAFTDPTLAPGRTPIRAAHVAELREALTLAYGACGRSTVPTYTDPAPAAGVSVLRAAHLTELRDAVAGLADAPGPGGCPGGACTVMGAIAADATFTADNAYLLRGAVFVRAPATLTIEAGTVIRGDSETNGTLIVERGARIHADGTAAAPVVMTSDREPGMRSRGDWGGLVINGRAPINLEGGETEGPGGTGPYGGSDPDDDSGHLRHVRVEFAGTELSPDNELNGIAFQGVGRGTEVDHVMVKMGKDDGLELNGGTVDLKRVVSFGNGDDGIDWADGWQGRVQFLVVMQIGDDADHGIEADNRDADKDAEPRSSPTLYNLTLVGDPDTNEGDEGQSEDGMRLRRGTAATVRNFVVTGFKKPAVDVRGGATWEQVDAGALSFAGGIVWNNCTLPDEPEDCNGQFTADRGGRSVADLMAGSDDVAVVDPRLASPFSLTAPDFTPGAGSPAVTGAVAPAAPPDDGFFEPAGFIGAVGGAGSGRDTWWRGWTDFSMR